LNEVQHGKERRNFLFAVVWESRFRAEVVCRTVANMFSGIDDLAIMMEDQDILYMIADPAHYLFDFLSGADHWDQYWCATILYQRDKEKPDLKRAYEELWKCCRGVIPPEDTRKTPEKLRLDELAKKNGRGVFGASIPVVRHLIDMVHRTWMQQVGLTSAPVVNIRSPIRSKSLMRFIDGFLGDETSAQQLVALDDDHRKAKNKRRRNRRGVPIDRHDRDNF